MIIDTNDLLVLGCTLIFIILISNIVMWFKVLTAVSQMRQQLVKTSHEEKQQPQQIPEIKI